MKWIILLITILFFVACDDKVKNKECTDSCDTIGKIV